MKNPFDDLRREQALERQKREDEERLYWQRLEVMHKNQTQLWKQYDNMVTEILHQLQVALLPNHRVDSRPPKPLRELRQFWEELLRSPQGWAREAAFCISPQLEPWVLLNRNRKRDDDNKILRRSFVLFVTLELDKDNKPLQFMCGYQGLSNEKEIEKTARCGLSRNELTLCLRQLVQNIRFV